MSAIVELRVAEEEFELGRVLRSAEPLAIELETMIPLREWPVPFFIVHDGTSEAFEESVARHPSVDEVYEVERHNGEVLYALKWDVSRDHFFEGIREAEGQLLAGRRTRSTWAFEIRFPTHEALSEFNQRCEDAGIPTTVDRVYSPTKPNEELWFGLTGPQRETLVRAVEGGYYDIPRRMSTNQLAEEFGISDQAITERLRRAIVALAEQTVIVPPVEDDE